MLQKEMLEIVDIKQQSLSKRYKTEFGEEIDNSFTWHDITEIDEKHMNMQFDKAGDSLIAEFQQNMTKLRSVLSRVDKDSEELFGDNDDDETGEEFKHIRSITHLKALLKNYWAVTEA